MITTASAIATVSVDADRAGEDLFAWLDRVHGGFDAVKYRQVLGAANPFKEGDASQGLTAADDQSRAHARRLLSNTTIGALLAHPIFEDEVVAFADARVDVEARRAIEPWTMGHLVRFLLDRIRGRRQGRHARPSERRHRVRRQADVERRAHRHRPEGVQPRCPGRTSGRAATWARASSRIRRPTRQRTS